MTEVTILLLEETFSSTAVGPMEVFRHAGSLWNWLTGTKPAPRFRVITASVDGRAVRCDGPIFIKPDVALTAIRKTDLIFIPTTGPNIEGVVERNAPVVPWLRRCIRSTSRRSASSMLRDVLSSGPVQLVWTAPPLGWSRSAPRQA